MSYNDNGVPNGSGGAPYNNSAPNGAPYGNNGAYDNGAPGNYGNGGPNPYGNGAPNGAPYGNNGAYGNGAPSNYGNGGPNPYGNGAPNGAPYGNNAAYGNGAPYGSRVPYGYPDRSSKGYKALTMGTSIFSLIFMLPFIGVGIFMIVRGIRAFATGNADGKFFLVFGALWSFVVVISLIRIIRNMIWGMTREKRRSEDGYDSGYGRGAQNFGGMATPSHDSCKADHRDDDDDDYFRKRGYE